MKIVKQYPPNFDKIKTVFEHTEEHRALFCYGDTIYNPYDVEVTPDLEKHEETHSRQQGTFPDIWWDEYLNNKFFRLEQEIEAYGEQIIFLSSIIEDSNLLSWFKEKIAQALSSNLYGNLLNYGQAVSKLRHYVKNNK
jgi:hypothetical protein